MKQMIAKPSFRSKIEHSQRSISSVGLNEEIFHSLESMKSLNRSTTAASSTFTISLLSYLHRMRIRDCPNTNFVDAFKSIAVDNEKIKNLSMVQWKSTITQCFKKNMRNEHLKLIETIYHCYEEKHIHSDGLPTSSMDVRYPLSALRVQSSLRLHLDPTSVSGEYQKKDSIVPLLMTHQDAKKHAEKFMHIVWTTMCFHEAHVSVHDLLHALKILVPHLDLRFVVLQASSPAFSQPFSQASSAPPQHRVTRQAFNKMLHTMTKYQHRIILHSCWHNVADFERCTKLVASLVKSQDRFIEAYVPMRLSSVELKYRFNKIRPIFRAWRKYFDWIVALRAKVLSVENARRVKALYHLHGVSKRMAAAHVYYKRTKSIAATNWLRISFQRVRRITSRLREYKMKKLNRMAHIFFQKIHVRNCFTWWIDVYNEETQLPLAISHSVHYIQKYWFSRLLKYIRRQISDRKRDAMRAMFRKQEEEEQLIVDEKNTFFLTQKELKDRQKRKEAHDLKVKEEKWQQHWVIERKKAAQGKIRIDQARERIAHRAHTKQEAIQNRSDVWTTMELSVLPRVAEKARTFCTATPEGKHFVREQVADMFRTSMAQAQHLMYKGELNIPGCTWQAISEVKGVWMSPVAWSHTSGESVKYEKMTGKQAKQICIERHIASELLKVKEEFQRRKDEENRKNFEMEACLMLQSSYRMRQGRIMTMKIFQEHWMVMVDCSSGNPMWYNLKERRVMWQQPLMLHRREIVQRFSTFNARGPDDNGTYWYEERPQPYRPEKKPKSSNWHPPEGLMLCEHCHIAITRRRCRGAGCIEDRSCKLYLCIFCYDQVHPVEATGVPEVDEHRNHAHDTFVCPSMETFFCSVCATKSASKYCRDGECVGNLYCSTCYAGVHSQEKDCWHVPDDLYK